MAEVGQVEPSAQTSPAPRWVGPVAIAVAVLPIWFAAIKNGIGGLFPTSDAAATVLRAHDVFAGPFPLAGMPAASATSGGYQSYFPGAWQLYAIALPTRLFGDIWGPLLAMALLNTVWVALAGWLLLRRLRLAEALIGIAFVTALLWSLGSGFLITPVPMDMVVIPTALFLIAVWAVADGDLVAVPVLAVVANYLWLDHLVLVVTVPVVGLCAPIGLWLWIRREKGRDPEGEQVRRRRVWRSCAMAAVITVVMWIPTLVQQFTANPGNLRVLFASAGVDRPTVGSWTRALHDVVSVGARPPFWLRGSFASPSYLRRELGGVAIGDLSVFDLAATLAIVAAIVTFAVLARRRGDRTGLWLLIVAGVALAVAVVTTNSAPVYLGPPTGYLRSLWPTAMFAWFALTVNVLRAVRVPLRRPVVLGMGAVIVVLSALNLPTAAYGYDSHPRTQQIVRAMNESVIPQIGDHEPVMVSTGLGFDSHRFSVPLRLALERAGVEYCVPTREILSDGSRPRCSDDVDTVVDVRVITDASRVPSGEVLVRQDLLAPGERAELRRLDKPVGDWVRSHDHLTLSPAARRRLKAKLTPNQQREVFGLLNVRDNGLDRLQDSPGLVGAIRLWYAGDDPSTQSLFTDSPLTRAEWRRWLELSQDDKTLLVTERPLVSRG